MNTPWKTKYYLELNRLKPDQQVKQTWPTFCYDKSPKDGSYIFKLSRKDNIKQILVSIKKMSIDK